MTVTRRTLTAAILSTMCALSMMSASARADAPTEQRAALVAAAPPAH